MTCRTILLLISALLFSTPLYADMAAANYELNRGNFKAAAKEFSRLAEAGDVHAQSYLGYMYFVGQGVDQDYAEAVRWYRKAAEKGDRDAEYNLAVAYAFGQGVKKDLKKAVQWYLKAAEQGHAAAEYSLGISYANGEGIKQDTETAMRWFSKAADQGYAGAEKALDILRKQDATAAAKHDTDKSVNSKNKEDLLNMDGLVPSLPGAQMPARILPEHAPTAIASAGPATTSDNSAAKIQSRDQENHSPDLYEGIDNPATEVKQDVTPEFKSLDEPAIDSTATSGAVSMDDTNKTGGESAGSFLNRLFGPQATGQEKDNHAAGMDGGDDISGTVQPAQAAVSENTSRDEKQVLLSHLLGNANSMTSEEDAGSRPVKNSETGKAGLDPSIYKRGMAALANKNYRDAATLFHDAARQGDPGSQFQLGALFYQGLGVTRNYNEAKHWYQLAADNGNADAQYSLGNMYLMGEGVEQNDKEALYWYKKAADQGNKSARQNLENLKEIMSKASEKPDVAEGDVSANDPVPAKEKPKQGFFGRLFGKDKSKTARNASGITTQQSDNKVATVNGGKKPEEKPSFMSKEGGGLFGHLFGTDQKNDDQNGHKTIPEKDEQSNTGTTTEAASGHDSDSEQPVADTKQDKENKPSIMSKEGGGLFGYLFGWGQQKDKPEVSEQDKSSTTSRASSQTAGTNDDTAAQ
jgi:TPR repeat protein